MRYTYDEEADAVYLYLVDAVGWGAAKRSTVVPLEDRSPFLDPAALKKEFTGSAACCPERQVILLRRSLLDRRDQDL